jgi:plasmid replication initiation protein
MKIITKGLMKKGFEVKEGNRTLQINWLASAEYFDREGIVEIEFSQKMKPFLLQLKNCFTLYEFGQIKDMRGQYSIRIYELLKQYENIPSKCRSFSVDNLRTILGIEEDQYTLYADFKRRVIKSAKEEMDEYADISFDLEEIKDGRKVIELKFYIKENNKKIQDIEKKPKLVKSISTRKLAPVNCGNFEQRKYGDEYFDKLFKDV